MRIPIPRSPAADRTSKECESTIAALLAVYAAEGAPVRRGGGAPFATQPDGVDEKGFQSAEG